jgi:type VI secretion system protein
MKLILSQSPDARVPPLDPAFKIVNRTTLTIGRGSDNGWVLPDPDRDLSKLHCTINYSNGLYSITDVSTNGVFLNGSAERVHRGATVMIEDGDTIRLGPYSFSVRVVPLDAQTAAPANAGRLDPPPPTPNFLAPVPVSNLPDPFGGLDPFGLPGSSGAAIPLPSSQDTFTGKIASMLEDFDLDDFLRPQPTDESPFGGSQSPPSGFGAQSGFGGQSGFGAPSGFGASSGFGRPAEPGYARGGDEFDMFGDKARSSEWSGPAQPDHVPSTSQFFTPPKLASSAIPDNWDFLADEKVSPPPTITPPAIPAPAIPAAVEPKPATQPFAVVKPVAPSAIPDDWDFMSDQTAPPQPTVHDAPVVEARPVPEPQPVFEAQPDIGSQATLQSQAVPAPKAEIDPFAGAGASARPAQPAATRPAGSADAEDLLAAFLAGAGLGADAVSAADPRAVMNTIGQSYRQMVEGLREILMARSMVKNEFRMTQTVIAARNNNPLKFSFDAEAAVKALLQPPRPGYLPAQQSIAEGFKDIQAHNIAVMAGMQVALKLLLSKFNPESLAQNLEKSSMLSNILPSGRKARYWEAFVAAYSNISREAEDDFLGVFGKEFARAYEEQVGKL